MMFSKIIKWLAPADPIDRLRDNVVETRKRYEMLTKALSLKNSCSPYCQRLMAQRSEARDNHMNAIIELRIALHERAKNTA